MIVKKLVKKVCFFLYLQGIFDGGGNAKLTSDISVNKKAEGSRRLPEGR